MMDQLAGAILVSGYCGDQSVIAAAEQLAVKGLILASMHPSLFAQAVGVDLPILLIEGFGQHPMNSLAWKILTANAGLLAAINAEPVDVYTGWRPEVIIPNRILQERGKPATIEIFAPGKKVRLIGLSRLGQVGDLIDLIGETQLLNGLTATAARVQLEDGELVNIPLANLEILV